MRIIRYPNRAYLHSKFLNLEMFKSHINYTWWFGGECYCVSIPFNLFNKKKYGMFISPDGTPGNARYYRPKREWGLVEPWLDPGYREARREANLDE